MADIPCERNRAKQTPLTTTAAMVLFSAFQQTIGVSLDWKDTTFPSNAKAEMTLLYAAGQTSPLEAYLSAALATAAPAPEPQTEAEVKARAKETEARENEAKEAYIKDIASRAFELANAIITGATPFADAAALRALYPSAVTVADLTEIKQVGVLKCKNKGLKGVEVSFVAGDASAAPATAAKAPATKADAAAAAAAKSASAAAASSVAPATKANGFSGKAVLAASGPSPAAAQAAAAIDLALPLLFAGPRAAETVAAFSAVAPLEAALAKARQNQMTAGKKAAAAAAAAVAAAEAAVAAARAEHGPAIAAARAALQTALVGEMTAFQNACYSEGVVAARGGQEFRTRADGIVKVNPML